MKINQFTPRNVVPSAPRFARHRYGLGSIMALFFGSVTLLGSPLTFSGGLPDPNAVLEVRFTLNAPENLTIATTSVTAGGFDAVLWLFDSTGTTQLYKDDPPTNTDATISVPNFAAGTYELVLSAFDQHYCLANTLCNSVQYPNTGWSYKGLANFGGRSSAYGLTISAGTEDSAGIVDPTPASPGSTAPETNSAGLLLSGGALLVCFRAARARKRSVRAGDL